MAMDRQGPEGDVPDPAAYLAGRESKARGASEPAIPLDRIPEDAHPSVRRLVEDEAERAGQARSDDQAGAEQPDPRSEQVTRQFRPEAGGAAVGPIGARSADRPAYPEPLPYPGEPGWKSPDVTSGRGGGHAARSRRPWGEPAPPPTPEAPSARPNREKKGLFGRLLSGKEKPRSANSDRIKLPPANSDRIKLPPRRPKPER